jgi:hypothetical protein
MISFPTTRVTPQQVPLDPGRGRTKTGQLGAYAADDRPRGGLDPPGSAEVDRTDRKTERLFTHLAGFKGVLQSMAMAPIQSLRRSRPLADAFET